MGEHAKSYNASEITVLHGWEAIRQRPGMYVGSTSERGLHQAVFEVVGWAVNEVLAGPASSIDVTLTPDGGVSVAHNGPGVLVEALSNTDGPGIEALLTRMPAGWEPVGRNTAAMGPAVLGLYVTNALSSRLTAEVRRDGTCWIQQYTRGVPVAPPTAAGAAADGRTAITFWPDPDIFKTVECSFAVLAERLRELAFLNRPLGVSLTDTRHPDEPRSVRFRSSSGVRDFVAFLDVPVGRPVHPDVIGFEWEDQQMEGTAEVALRWNASHDESVRSFANSRPTPCGGTHVEGFREGVAAAVNAYAREHRLLTDEGPDLSADRISVGLTAVVSVKLDSPSFEGATRGSLGNATVRNCVEQAVREHLRNWLETHSDQAAAVIDQITSASQRG